MSPLQSFMSEKKLSAEAVKLEDPRPDFLIQRIQSHAAFESERQSELQIAQASPLVRWATVALCPVVSEAPSRLDVKTPA